MKIFASAILSAALIAASCQSKKTEVSSRFPEEVVREWQRLIDNNRFEEAKGLSTEKTKVMMSVYGASFEGEPVTVETKFVSINCKEDGNQAICKCLIRAEDGSDTYEDEFFLLKEEGKWLVDLQGFDAEGDENMLERDSTASNL